MNGSRRVKFVSVHTPGVAGGTLSNSRRGLMYPEWPLDHSVMGIRDPGGVVL